jgi:hypothetical protein
VRALRALLRHRIQLVRLRTLVGNRIHAVAADHGYDRPAGYWSGPGRAWLASLDLPPASRRVIGDDLALIDALAGPIAALDAQARQRAKAEPGVKVLTQLPGVGEFTALVILAETGDITRFASARKLAAWAGLTPTVRGPAAPSATAASPNKARPGCAGPWARPPRPPNAHPSSPPPTRPSPPAAASRSPPPRSPANCSPAPGTCSPPRASPAPPSAHRRAYHREGRRPRARSPKYMSRPTRRARVAD